MRGLQQRPPEQDSRAQGREATAKIREHTPSASIARVKIAGAKSRSDTTSRHSTGSDRTISAASQQIVTMKALTAARRSTRARHGTHTLAHSSSDSSDGVTKRKAVTNNQKSSSDREITSRTNADRVWGSKQQKMAEHTTLTITAAGPIKRIKMPPPMPARKVEQQPSRLQRRAGTSNCSVILFPSLVEVFSSASLVLALTGTLADSPTIRIAMIRTSGISCFTCQQVRPLI